MSLIMTVIASPGTGTILADVISDLRTALPLSGSPEWLAPSAACDLPLIGISAEAAEAAARRAIGDAAIDVLVQPAVGRRKRVLVAAPEGVVVVAEQVVEPVDREPIEGALRRIFREQRGLGKPLV